MSESGRSWVRRYHTDQVQHDHTRAPPHTVHMHTRGNDGDDDDGASTVGRMRSKAARAMSTVDFVGSYALSPGGVHGMFVFFFFSLSFPPARFASLRHVPRGTRAPLCSPCAARVVPARAATYSPGQTATFQERSSTGPTSESGLSRRSYLHVNDDTAIASWLVIGFRLRAPLRRPRRPPSSGAGNIDVSL